MLNIFKSACESEHFLQLVIISVIALQFKINGCSFWLSVTLFETSTFILLFQMLINCLFYLR